MVRPVSSEVEERANAANCHELVLDLDGQSIVDASKRREGAERACGLNLGVITIPAQNDVHEYYDPASHAARAATRADRRSRAAALSRRYRTWRAVADADRRRETQRRRALRHLARRWRARLVAWGFRGWSSSFESSRDRERAARALRRVASRAWARWRVRRGGRAWRAWHAAHARTLDLDARRRGAVSRRVARLRGALARLALGAWAAVVAREQRQERALRAALRVARRGAAARRHGRAARAVRSWRAAAAAESARRARGAATLRRLGARWRARNSDLAFGAWAVVAADRRRAAAASRSAIRGAVAAAASSRRRAVARAAGKWRAVAAAAKRAEARREAGERALQSAAAKCASRRRGAAFRAWVLAAAATGGLGEPRSAADAEVAVSSVISAFDDAFEPGLRRGFDLVDVGVDDDGSDDGDAGGARIVDDARDADAALATVVAGAARAAADVQAAIAEAAAAARDATSAVDAALAAGSPPREALDLASIEDDAAVVTAPSDDGDPSPRAALFAAPFPDVPLVGYDDGASDGDDASAAPRPVHYTPATVTSVTLSDDCLAYDDDDDERSRMVDAAVGADFADAPLRQGRFVRRRQAGAPSFRPQRSFWLAAKPELAGPPRVAAPDHMRGAACLPRGEKPRWR